MNFDFLAYYQLLMQAANEGVALKHFIIDGDIIVKKSDLATSAVPLCVYPFLCVDRHGRVAILLSVKLYS